LISVMAGLVPAIHALGCRGKDVDARDKPAHDVDTRVLLFGHIRRESDSAACESLDITCLCPNSNTPAAKGWVVSRASFEGRSLMLARASG
jgi:hypothetical protein